MVKTILLILLLAFNFQLFALNYQPLYLDDPSPIIRTAAYSSLDHPSISTKRLRHFWLGSFGNFYLSLLSTLRPRNLSDLIFKFYTPLNEEWIYWYPNLSIEWSFKIADALYRTFLFLKNSNYALCLYAITYLAYVFRNQTYIDEAEQYWNYLYSNAVNSDTHFMKAKSNKNMAALDVELWSLYLLWKMTGRSIYYDNMTVVIQKYEELVLRKMGLPLSWSLKTNTLLNASEEEIMDVNNNSIEILTWRSSMYGILIFLAEKGLANKTLVAESLHNLIDLLYWDAKKILYEGVKICIYNDSGAYSYGFYTYKLFGSSRQHTQRYLPFIWANKTLYNENTSSILKILGYSAYRRYYEPSKKVILYGPWGLSDIEQYGMVPIYSIYFLNKTNISDLINSSIVMYTVGAKRPVLWWTYHKVGVKHSVKAYISTATGSYSVSGGTNEYRVYVHTQMYQMLSTLVYLTEHYWILHNPHFYYAVNILYTKSVRQDGYYYDYLGTSWTRGVGFTSWHGFDLFAIYYNAHPNFTFIDNVVTQCGSRLMRIPRLLLSPYQYPKLGYGNFSAELINIHIPHDRPSFIFIPSQYHIKAIKVETATSSSITVIGENNYSYIQGSGYNYTFSALPDNIILFNPQNASIKDLVVNITIDFLDFYPPNWYETTEDNKISFAYWLAYHTTTYRQLDPEEDYDNDGVPTKYEVLFFSNPFDNDTDNDGIDDAEEIYFFINPVSRDADCDGLTDKFELNGATKWSQYLPHELDPRDARSYNSSYYDTFYGYIMENQSDNLLLWDQHHFNETMYRKGLDTDEDNVNNYDEYYVYGTDPFEKDIGVKITSPDNNSILNYTELEIKWIYYGSPNRFSIYKNGSLVDTLYPPTTTHNITLTQGAWNITIIANYTDYSVSDQIILTIDIMPPTVEITDPTNNTITNQTTITILWVGIDNVGMDHYEIRVDNASWINVGDDTAYTINLVGGQHRVEVKAIDIAGNINTTTVLITVDLTPPWIEILQPANNTITNKTTITISWYASDNLFIDHFEIYLNDSSINKTIPPGINNYSIILLDGINKIEIRAVDAAGNMNTTTIIVIYDNTPPLITILTPKNNTITNQSTITISWSATDNVDIDHYEIKIDNGSWIYNGDNTTYTAILSDGIHNITIKAVDITGNINTTTITIIVDREPPMIEIFTPENNTYTNQTTITVSWLASDNIGLDHYELYIDDTPINKSIPENITTYNICLQPGTHNIMVKAVDIAGNINKTILTIIVIDTSPPIITIDEPQNNTYINSSMVTVSWSARDNSQIDHYEIRIDDEEWINIDNNTTYIAYLDEGTHRITVKAIDIAGNINKTTILITIDITPPMTTILEPANNTVANQTTITISWEASDNSGIDHYELYINNTPIDTTIPQNTTTYLLDLSEGKYFLVVKTIDMAGNQNSSLLIIIIDITPPEIIVLAPDNNTYINTTTITIMWKSIDISDIAQYEIEIDNRIWIYIGKNTSYTVALAEGTHIISIYGVDLAGNTNTTKILITIDITPPKVELLQPQNYTYTNKSTLTIQWTATDNIKIDHYEVKIDREEWIDTGTTTQLMLSLLEGMHTVRVKAIDIAGNQKIILLIIAFDFTPPQIIEISPNSTTNTTIRIKINIRENIMLDHIEIRVDNGEWINIGQNNTIILKLEIGKHLIEVKAIDKAGNIAIKQATIEIKSTQQANILPIIIAIVLATTLVTMIIIIIYRKSRSSRSADEIF